MDGEEVPGALVIAGRDRPVLLELAMEFSTAATARGLFASQEVFARASLSCFPRGRCRIHGVTVPCLAVLRGQAPTPAGLRLLAQGLDGESTLRAIMIWGMSGACWFLSERVNLPFRRQVFFG